MSRRDQLPLRGIACLAFSVTLAPAWAFAEDPAPPSASRFSLESTREPGSKTASERQANSGSESEAESESTSKPQLDAESASESVSTAPAPTPNAGTPEAVTPAASSVGHTKSDRKALRKARWRFSLDAPRRVGIETSLLWPAYPGLFFHLKSTVPIHQARGEVLLGAQGRVPQVRPEEGTFSNLDAVLGWRQYAVHGIHFDVMLNMGWGRLRDSTANGRDYDSFDIELMAVAGWRFGVGPLYFAIQPLGISNVLNRTNPWPIEGRGTPRTEGPIYVGNVLFGVQF